MRCFIALPLPEEAREALYRSMAALRGRWPRLAWASPGGYHLTLAFLGEIGQDAVACAHRALEAAAKAPCLEFSFSSFEYLPPRGRPRVLYAGLLEQPAGASETAYRLLNEALAKEGREAGLPPLNAEWGPGGRPYLPHATLARVKPGAAFPEREALSRFAPPGGAWTIDRCALYRSELRPGGAVYSELGVVGLLSQRGD